MTTGWLKRNTPALALLAASVLWGSGFVFAKLALQDLTVSQVVAYRFGLGSIVLLSIAYPLRQRISVRDVGLFGICGVLTVPVTYLLQFEGIRRLNASTAALVSGALPIVIALAGLVCFRERPTARSWIAVLLSTLGVIFIADPGRGVHDPWGIVFVILSLIAIAFWTVLSKTLVERYTVPVATAVSISLGSMVTFAYATWLDGLAITITLRAGIAIALSGVICTALAYLLWNWGLAQTSVTRAGLYANIETVSGVALASILLRERPTSTALVGGALVIIAALAGDVSTDSRKESLVSSSE